MRDANNTKVGYTALCAIPLEADQKDLPPLPPFLGPVAGAGPGGPA